MKIYVVTKGTYSDYHIITATLDEERAKKIAELCSDCYEECDVEVYEDGQETIKPIYEVVFDNKTGDVNEVYTECSSYGFRHINEVRISPIVKSTYVYVFADSSEEAIKIAAEKRAEHLAKKEGLV